jgi:hypothetical protein
MAQIKWAQPINTGFPSAMDATEQKPSHTQKNKNKNKEIKNKKQLFQVSLT